MTFEQVAEGMRFSQVSGPDCTATKYENGGWSMDDGDGGGWYMDRDNFHLWRRQDNNEGEEHGRTES